MIRPDRPDKKRDNLMIALRIRHWLERTTAPRQVPVWWDKNNMGLSSPHIYKCIQRQGRYRARADSDGLSHWQKYGRLRIYSANTYPKLHRWNYGRF